MSGSYKPSRARFQPRSEGGAGQGPSTLKKRKVGPKLEVVAPHASLHGLPDNVLLLILGYLNLVALVMMSRVCLRFHHLSKDMLAWESVALTRESMGKKLNALTLKRIIRSHLLASLSGITLEETNLRGNAVITEALLDLLFTRCPKIESMTLIHCDMRKFPASCPVFTSDHLCSVTFRGCELTLDWLSLCKPSWRDLRTLSLENCSKTNSRDIRFLADNKDWQNSLRSVDLRGCYRISLEAVQHLCSSLSALQMLDIRHCRLQINDELVSSVQGKRNFKLLN